MCHVCGFICYLCVELKLMINTRSLSNQALKSAQTSLLNSRCWPWGGFIGAGQPLQHSEVRDTNLAWVRPVGVPTLSGKDVSAARSFLGPPLRRCLPFAGRRLARVAYLPAGFVPAACLRTPIKGATRFLRTCCFMVFPLFLFKWDLWPWPCGRAWTHWQPIKPPSFKTHNLTIATLHGHGSQQTIPDVAYHLSIGSKVAVHKEVLYRIPLGMGWGMWFVLPWLSCTVSRSRLPRSRTALAPSPALCMPSGRAWRSPWCGSWHHDNWTEMPSNCHRCAHSCHEGFTWCACSIQAKFSSALDERGALAADQLAPHHCHRALHSRWPLLRRCCPRPCCRRHHRRNGDVPVGMRKWPCPSGPPGRACCAMCADKLSWPRRLHGHCCAAERTLAAPLRSLWRLAGVAGQREDHVTGFAISGRYEDRVSRCSCPWRHCC